MLCGACSARLTPPSAFWIYALFVPRPGRIETHTVLGIGQYRITICIRNFFFHSLTTRLCIFGRFGHFEVTTTTAKKNSRLLFFSHQSTVGSHLRFLFIIIIIGHIFLVFLLFFVGLVPLAWPAQKDDDIFRSYFVQIVRKKRREMEAATATIQKYCSCVSRSDIARNWAMWTWRSCECDLLEPILGEPGHHHISWGWIWHKFNKLNWTQTVLSDLGSTPRWKCCFHQQKSNEKRWTERDREGEREKETRIAHYGFISIVEKQRRQHIQKREKRNNEEELGHRIEIDARCAMIEMKSNGFCMATIEILFFHFYLFWLLKIFRLAINQFISLFRTLSYSESGEFGFDFQRVTQMNLH